VDASAFLPRCDRLERADSRGRRFGPLTTRPDREPARPGVPGDPERGPGPAGFAASAAARSRSSDYPAAWIPRSARCLGARSRP
jgi:hypothetical protein